MVKMDRNNIIAGSVICFSLILLFSLILITGNRGEEERSVLEEEPVQAVEKEIPAPAVTPEPELSTTSIKGTVGRNMNFFDLMCRYISPQEVHGIVKASSDLYDLRRIYPGQKYTVYRDEAGEVSGVHLSINDEQYLDMELAGGDISVRRRHYPYTVHRKIASGIINNSLYHTIHENNLPGELAAALSNIYAWDIDFFTELRQGDYFRLVYEEKRIRKPGGEIVSGIGKIISCEFNCDGEKHYAFLYRNDGDDFSDYFDEEGNSLRKQLLKAPLSYTRISSNFSHRRYHPVLHRYRPHLGIDYAAPLGTPVHSTGDGTVIKASRTRANGNYVKIRHNSNYISYYLHLHRFASGIKYGAKVKQGQIIGYVGSTGYSTGPHLDYRIRKNGRFVNPRKLDLPPASPVAETVRDDFIARRNRLLAELNSIEIQNGIYYSSGGDNVTSGRVDRDMAPVSQAQSSSSR
ncbi:MAG: peptidoglycan DD-metalloendopeptidase family protein [Candidatus Latescibacteria bacterium]|nr:peptidoglycan DD-metalloendopeptidase family protein [bacterium]MBD3425585.1 peptidoglycan DD-metalloendopeptidase family protein [Candidatus Latescibacterota bacterium]